MRLFFGIEIPEKEREKIENLKKKINFTGKIKWVEKENLHITLIFLGEKNLEDVLKCVDRISVEPFEISLKGFGVFPDMRRPRVLWIGVDKGKEKIVEIYEILSKKLKSLNIEEEKSFTPHLTIGRIKFGKVSLNGLNYESEIFNVKEVVLFSSILRDEGPLYEKKKIFKLEER
jgi:2'-5' RNA ligase